MIDTEQRIAWLAGVFDGEGSIGIMVNSHGTYQVQAQMEMNCEATMAEVVRVMQAIGVQSVAYTLRPRNELRHRVTYKFSIVSMPKILLLARALAPHSVTKRERWEIAIDWIERRIEAAGGLMENGWIKRGGGPYTDADHRQYSRMKRLNTRGV